MDELNEYLVKFGLSSSLPTVHAANPENIPIDVYRLHIAEKVSRITGVGVDTLFDSLDTTSKPENGDLTLAVPRLRLKGKPVDLAQKIKEEFGKSPLIENVETYGIFLRFFYSKPSLTDLVLPQILHLSTQYGRNNIDKGKKVIVEFSSPNIAKPFHAGHLRSTIIGAFLANLHEACGWEVIRMNYLGDWGKQFGLLAVSFQQFGDEDLLEQDPIQHLFDLYVRINAIVETEKADDARAHGLPWPLPKKDPKSAKNTNAEMVYKPISPTEVKAREFFHRMENGEEAALAIWKRFRGFSIEKYIETYSRLNITYDVYSGESQVSPEYITAAENILNEKGLLIEDNGALLIDLTKFGSEKAMLRKKDGTTLYLTRDVGAAKERFDKYNFDKMIYVVSSQQDLHLKQLFKILELIGYDWAKNCIHINFGMVQGMSTRKGTVVKLDDMLEEAKNKMHEVMKQNEKKYAQVEDPDATADIVGKAAIMIQDMSSRRVLGYSFAWDRMLSFEGDTGPYLQYAHARLFSIQRNTGFTTEDALTANFSLLNEPIAFKLLRSLTEYPEVVRQALEKLEPSTIVTYLFKMTHLLSSSYEILWVLGQEKELAKARFALYLATRYVLGNGMKLLGLTPLERM